MDDFCCDADQDELVEEAEDWVFHSDHTDSENDAPLHENDEPRSTLSRDGTERHKGAEVVGCWKKTTKKHTD